VLAREREIADHAKTFRTCILREATFELLPVIEVVQRLQDS
jgi:hypothetical protein